VRGAELIRDRLAAALDDEGQPLTVMEKPGLFVFDDCRHWLRTVPGIARSAKHEDDADTDAEDHLYDLTRYRILAKPASVPFAWRAKKR
jgi:hypothetical protein